MHKPVPVAVSQQCTLHKGRVTCGLAWVSGQYFGGSVAEEEVYSPV